MYFKRLELIGFKSFAEKTILEFEPGVTAIVGPNGCGKSNVSDAIRWVLGEQSPKSMRGLSMEDVIFNGTATREPVNFAEVSLVLHNDASAKILAIEYDEVVISRRLYRSGESEYLINKNVVRLKDIQDILAGTGLGVSNYSIIEQGKIDQLINSKPEARRELFDEAAGITRFKSRKREALRKLELTEQNLQRVNDIISEVKRQISSIERQARKAENYKKDFERLKRWDLWHARRDLGALSLKGDALGAQIASFEGRNEAAQAALHDVNRVLREARERLTGVEKTFSEVRTQEALLDSRINNASEKKALYAERIQENTEKDASLEGQLDKSRVRAGELESEYTVLAARHAAILEEARVGEDALRALDERYRALEAAIKNALKTIEEAKIALIDNASKHAQTQNEITKAESSIHNLASRRHRLDLEKLKVNTEWEETRLRFEEIARDVDRLNQDIRAKIIEREALEGDLAGTQNALRDARERLQQTKNERSSVESKLDVLVEITTKHEGFSQGVRFILDRSREDELVGRGVVGALADLVEVNRGYELALEVALEGFAESVICLGDEDMLHAAQLLKDSNRGQATFVSMEDYAQPPRKPVSPVNEPEARPLADFTRSNPRITSFYEALTAHVYVVKSVEDAVRLKRAYPELTFVTKRGELCRAGMFVGGSFDASDESLLFGRETRINELRGKLAELDIDIDRWSRKETELHEREQSLNDGIKAYAVALPKLQVELADLSSRQDHLARQKGKLEEEVTVVDSELTETAGEIQAAREREASLRAAAAFLDQLRSEREEALKAGQSFVDEQHVVRENLLVEATRMRSAQETLEARKAQAQKDVERSSELLESERAALVSFEDERRQIAERTVSMQEQIRQLENEITASGEERERLLQRNQDILTEREKAVLDVEALESRKSGTEEEVLSAQKECHDLQVELNALQHERERLVERIQVNYQADLAAPPPAAAERQDGSVPQERAEADGAVLAESQPTDDLAEIEAVREKLAKVGPVNLVAIEEHEELKARYEFLLKEQTDLFAAKDDIHKAILKMNRQTREMFADAFTKIQSVFVEYFKLLFAGGSAELVLLDESDVLESGIEIVARPPGKKLQSITLMSGGEKALTAIALLFAVLKVKPTPFCILDEIDAPLDELNVQRFSGVLHEFVKGSQFIIITHNKRTMGLADVMYGITMQQTGMSKIVSVKFAGEGEEEPADDRKVMV